MMSLGLAGSRLLEVIQAKEDSYTLQVLDDPSVVKVLADDARKKGVSEFGSATAYYEAKKVLGEGLRIDLKAAAQAGSWTGCWNTSQELKAVADKYRVGLQPLVLFRAAIETECLDWTALVTINSALLNLNY